MRYRRLETPAYVLWVEQRPSNNGKGKAAYQLALKRAAQEITAPIETSDVEVEIVYSTSAASAQRMDVDNVNKSTLDGLKAVAFRDDAQVRRVSSSIFVRGRQHAVQGRVEHLGRLFYSPSPHVVLIIIYSDTRLQELGGPENVQRMRYEEWQREFAAELSQLKHVDRDA